MQHLGALATPQILSKGTQRCRKVPEIGPTEMNTVPVTSTETGPLQAKNACVSLCN